ncbi:beta-N-acetylhexosaminidase [Mariniplasma anaerobium]|uniref:N-acetyl-beta-D-glucosaminidase n=1 Tax=Mariniplasma anaerobium TaxID=2735436 RepID=A0A7U9XWY9_9MOLU|nr:beta-N-acetylhexosaminidase [Mariniplasma anaerobium]BCR36077.1 N-acetyl-beta-D-glucosaminidase [Mariniplasma anaerobium]
MNIKGIEIIKEIQNIKAYTAFKFDGIDSIEFKVFDDYDYQIIKTNKTYVVYYRLQRDIYAALGYILSHKNHKDYDIKRSRKLKSLGYMIDCARNAVPTIDTLKRQVVNLSLMGYTYIGLYLEDLFELDDQEEFGYMRGRYTTSQISDLITFSKRFDIKVIPYIQTLAHLNAIFKHAKYNAVLDTADILLVDEPKTYELIEKMLVTAQSMFHTNEINIGMDEAWQLGLGKYLNRNGYQNRMDIMLNHLDKVLDICKKNNIKASMWADMFFHLKGGAYFSKGVTSFDDIKDMIPSDVELIYWDYYHTDQKDYDDKFASLKTLTSNYGFAGGAWKWVGFAPFNGFSEKASIPAIEACKKANVDHFVVTSWGDNGAEASMFSILPSLLFISQSFYEDDLTDENKFLYGLTGYSKNQWMSLDLLNQIYPSKEIKTVNPSKYLLFEDLLLGDSRIKLHKDYEKSYQDIKDIIEPLTTIDSPYVYIFNTLYDLSFILSIKSTLSIKLYELYHKKDKEGLLDLATIDLSETIDLIKQFYKDFNYQWHYENKPYGFEVQSYRFGGLIQRLEDIKIKVLDYVKGNISSIEELDHRILNLADEDDPFLGCIYYNQFIKYVTFGTF